MTYLENISKIRATGGEYDFVGSELESFTAESDINQVLLRPKDIQLGDHIVLVVVPSQAEMICSHDW